MDLPKNVGGLDRILRGVLGIWLVAVGVAVFLDDRRVTADARRRGDGRPQ